RPFRRKGIAELERLYLNCRDDAAALQVIANEPVLAARHWRLDANVGLAPHGQGRRHRLPPRRRPHSPGARRRSACALLGTRCKRCNEWETAPPSALSRGLHTKQQQSPTMTDETDTQDLKALELEHLRAIEAQLDEIARDIAEMKAEALQFLAAQDSDQAAQLPSAPTRQERPPRF